MQLTDDAIDGFIVDLVNYLERHPCTIEDGVVTDEGFEHLSEFVFQRLEGFSNGYRNYN